MSARPIIDPGEPMRSFKADMDAYTATVELIGEADVKHGLDAALGASAGVLAGVMSYLVATFGRAEAKTVILDAVERHFARLQN